VSFAGAVVKPTTLDDLLSLWEVQKETGTPLSPEQLCSKCPELLAEFRWHVKALEAVDSHFGIVTDSRAASTPGFLADGSQSPPSVVRMSSEFVVEKLHASGGLGSVYLAHDPILNRRVALKFPRQIRQSIAARARFEREAHITSQLDHPGVVPVHAISTTEGSPSCYATRFVEGLTLRDAIREFHESGALTTGVEFRQLLQRFVTVCNIVAYAHDRRIVHRDIKPGNILLGAFGETLLIDWGLAKVLGEKADENPPDPMLVNRRPRESHDDITLSGQMMGTPAYANQLLTKAISNSELANRQTLNALRSLVDDVVISKFDEQTALSLSERQFLNSVLMQYQAYATLQDNSMESRAIRAEGLRQRGRIHMRLSDDIPALEDLRAASVLLRELLDEKGGSQYRAVLADTLKDISLVLLRTGKLVEAEATAVQGIQLCSTKSIAADHESSDSRAVRAALAELHRMQGTIQTRRQKWKDAASSFQLAEQLLDDLLILDPGNTDYQQSLSTVCRALSVTWGRTGDVGRMAKTGKAKAVLNEAVSALEAAAKRDQTETSRMSLAKARIALSACLRTGQAIAQARQQLELAAHLP